MKRCGTSVIVSCLALAGCADSASTIIDDPLVARAPQLELAVEARIDAGEHDLVPIYGLAVAPNGSIAVMQLQDHEVRFFSSKGDPLGSFGRRGAGPGEFIYLNRLGWIGDTLWVADGRLARITLVGPDRELLRTVSYPTRTVASDGDERLAFQWVMPFALYSDSLFLVSGQSEAIPVAYFKVSGDGALRGLLLEHSRRGEVRHVIADG